MKPTDMVRALQALIPTKEPVYLWGPPGVGKSSLVRQAAENMELEVVDVRAVLLDPVDMRGLPTVKDGLAIWAQPGFLPRHGAGVLFLDELAQAPPLVQAACLQLTLDRRCGEYELPPDWTVVAASNRQEDRAGAHRLITPLLNRFVHLDLEVSNDDWQSWALVNEVSPEVRAFLKFRPGLLFQFDPSRNERAFATPRSWEKVSNIVGSDGASASDLLHPLCMGTVGEGPATEFVAFCRIYRELPDIDQVLASPGTTKMPSDPSVLYALSGALVEKCRGADQPLLTRALQFVTRMPQEFSVLTFIDLKMLHPSIFRLPAAAEWLKKNRSVFIDQ